MFMLDKWYLDVVTGHGDVAVVYVARLRWGAARVSFASALQDAQDGTHRETRTIRGIEPTRLHAQELTWQSSALAVDGRWHRDAPPLRRTLLSTADGAIRWGCYMPRARGSVRLGGCTYEGLGYVERLRLTIKPWKLPFGALRWGRHLSDRHSLVWIAWEGSERRSWVWLDGEAQRDAVVTERGISSLTGGAELCVDDGRTVVDRDVLAAFTDLLPALARRVAGRLASMHEHKRVERSSIVRAGHALDHGWTLRELVTW